MEDVTLMLSAGAGHMPDDPLSYEDDVSAFTKMRLGQRSPSPIAFSRDHGEVAIEPYIANICESSMQKLNGMGTEISNDIRNFSGVMEGFHTLCAILLAVMMQPIL